MPQALLRKVAASIPALFEWFSGLIVLFIVIDAQPDLHLKDNEMSQQRWELESSQRRAFFWKNDHGHFDLGNG